CDKLEHLWKSDVYSLIGAHLFQFPVRSNGYLKRIPASFVIICFWSLSTLRCVEDAYQDKYSYTYDKSPQAEVYMEVLVDADDLPVGKFEFDHGLTVAESDSWRPPNSYYIDKYEYPNRKGALPYVNVDWYEAKVFCEAQFVDL